MLEASHRKKFLSSSMTGFLRSRFCRMLRKEEVLNRFFYLNFDPTILEERKARHEQSQQSHDEASTSGPKDPKEELAEEMTLDMENKRYNFFSAPLGAVFRLM